jgi:hypothetical protein
MPKDIVKNFFKGLVNVVEPQSIPEGAASDSLNWMTVGDKIELRRGMARLGAEITGTGLITGLRRGIKRNGSEILFRTRGRKIEYYDTATSLWVETSSNVLPSAANGEEIAIEPYDSLAGAQLIFSSRNSSIYKIMVANPGSITELSLASIFRGKIRIKQNRMFLWDQQGSSNQRDVSSVYGSYIDKDELTDYSQISAEARHNGDGSTKTFAGTLNFKGVNAQRTCFFVTFTDGTETFTDDYNGILTGTLGGTGTINYTTGAYSITFNTAPAVGVNNITSTYYYENTIDTGIADFSKSNPRTAGQGFVEPQFDGGGVLQNVLSFKDVEYCLHESKTWALTLTNTDTSATNLPFRTKVGIPNWRAACESPDGIYYIDNIDQNKPAVYLLEYNALSQQVEPKNISANLDLSSYLFTKAILQDWGRYLAMACRTQDSTVNNRLFLYDKLIKSWDIHDYYCSTLEIYNGTLVGGDSITDNVFTLFSGEDDDDSLISNFWNGNLSDNGLDRLKKAKRFKLQGAIGPDQQLKVSLSFDNGPFVEIGHTDDVNGHTYAIEGNGSYVDHSQRVSVGAPTIGTTEIGGGTPAASRIAYPYERDFKISLDKYEHVMVRFEAINIGYVSVSLYDFPDIRDKGVKAPAKYRG